MSRRRKKRGERIQKKEADLQRKEQELNGLGFFSSKWTGLRFVKFQERKNYRLDFGEKKQPKD